MLRDIGRERYTDTISIVRYFHEKDDFRYFQILIDITNVT